MLLSDFYKTDYQITYINCLRQYWKYEKKWSCIGSPKQRDLLLYFDGCSAKYKTKAGEEVSASDGDVVFCPKGSEYTVEFFDFKSRESGTVGINFLLSSKGSLPDTLECFSHPDTKSKVTKLEKLLSSERQVPMKYNILIAELLTTVGEHSEEVCSLDGRIIVEGVKYLFEHIYENIELRELARLSNVSEVYFRRLFKEQYGLSPASYRLTRRLIAGAEYLKYTDNSVTEIAELVGFTDSSYFIKRFREYFSFTPLAYRDKFLIN